MKTLIAAACVAVIAVAGYFFIQEYRTSVAAAKIAEHERTCYLAEKYRTLYPELDRIAYERCGL